MTVPFGDRLHAALNTWGPLCVGIDPHQELLAAWGLSHDARGVEEFSLRVVEAAHGRVGVVKPQVAFFERFGAAGFAALEKTLTAARQAGLLVIADAKRGDIGSTMRGYCDAWLSAGSPLEVDALTVSPYLGPASLQETVDTAYAAGKGLFVLAATSNPEAVGLQTSQGSEQLTVATQVVREAARAREDNLASDSGWGSVGLVIGATVDPAPYGLTPEGLTGLPILAPGFGAQGAGPEDIHRVFADVSDQVIANESRSILRSGPSLIAGTIESAAARYREVRHG
ncbi:orotidine-5'-phosphate decarboxylase [Microbacterium sp. YY-01]|uniref:orotidine-5'-phosphate decarboxylase n=1 Tax=Microbacterium sp. YY-01 TaxID=3421634 RepID=UPI003D168B24